MESKVRARMDELKREWDEARRRHPRLVLGVTGAFVLTAMLSTAGALWFLMGLRDGLPDQAAMQRIGEMDQATTVYDNTDSKRKFSAYIVDDCP